MSDPLAPGLRAYWEGARGTLLTHQVAGESMRPTLAPGDVLHADPRDLGAQPGDLVLARHPFRPLTLVKRVHAVVPPLEPGQPPRYDLRGDSSDPTESQDSRGFGPLRALLGRVVLVRRGLPPLPAAALRRLEHAAPSELARAASAETLRLAGALDPYGIEAHLELALTPRGAWLTATAAALPWLSSPWLRSALREAAEP